MRLWDAATGRLVRELSAGDKSRVFSVAFSPTDNRLLAVGYGGQADVSYVALWDIDAGTELARLPGATDLPDFPVDANSGVVGALAFSPDGKYLVAGFGSKYCYDSSKFSQSAEGLGGRHAPTDPPPEWTHGLLCFSRLLEGRNAAGQRQPRRDGDHLVHRRPGKRRRRSRIPIRTLLIRSAGRGMVEDVAFSPDGKTLAMASHERERAVVGRRHRKTSGNAQGAFQCGPGRGVFAGWSHPGVGQQRPDGPPLECRDAARTDAVGSRQRRAGSMCKHSRFPPTASNCWPEDEQRRLLVRRADRLERSRPSRRKTATAAAIERRLPEPHPDVVREPRLHEALEKLEKLVPEDVRVQAALAATRARRFAAQGNAHLADVARVKACALLEGMLAKQPENSVLAVELAQLLLATQENHKATGWTVLKPLEAKSKLGATLAILPDDSILACGANPPKDRYRVVLTVGKNIDLAAVRLEALTHASLPDQGPGRSLRGSFAQTSWNVTAASPDRKDPITLQFDHAWADQHEQTPGFPITPNGHWNISQSGEGRNCTAIWSMSKPVSLAAGTKLTFEMQFKESNDFRENLGCFRLSVSSDSAALGRERNRFAVWSFTDPWQELAAAYHILGDKQALDNLLKHHPAAAAGIGDLYAAHQDWERAIAEYRKLITDQPADAILLSKLAAAYESAGRTREAVAHLAKVSAANPQETMLSLKVAALQVWFGQKKEFAATRQRILAFAKDANDLYTVDRAAKACCLLPSTDKAQLEAALALSRTAMKVESSEWTLLGLGIAEYRIGNDTAAEEALRAVAQTGLKDPRITSTAAFYRAMSLFRQGKPDEARSLATAVAAKMRPLPKDEQNPLADNADENDLILWLAYREAKELIQFDFATPPKADHDKK